MSRRKNPLLGGVAMALMAPVVSAADDPAPGATGDVLSEVVVTGSRVARSGFEQPTPTVVVSPDLIENSAAATVAEALNLLPQLRATLTPATNTTNVASAGKNILDLRGLGAHRTLVLVDGKRFVSGILEGPVDTNAIPQALIEGVDIVTGGASAAYGSDAVAGVVNLRLLKNLDGLKATLNGGMSNEDDYRNHLASVAFGKAFAGGRGQFIFSGETAENDGVTSIYSRDWAGAGRGLVANPAFTATNAEPANLLVRSGARFSNSSYGGVINSGPLRGTQFGPGGVTLPFDYGMLTTARTQVGGDGSYLYNNLQLATPTQRNVAYGRISYDVADALNIYADASYADTRATAVSNTREDTSIRILDDNPFLPASIGTAMADNGITSFTMGRFSNDYGSVHVPSITKTSRVLAGAQGDIAAGWSYDIYYTHGETRSRQSPQGVRVTANYNFAVDAITDPATGAPICRNAVARANGCVPINLFGDGSPSAEAVRYITTNSFREAQLRQDVVSATFRGDPFATWAGPVSVALGSEYRRDSTDFLISVPAQNFALATGNGLPWDGRVEVKEGFAEAVVPVAGGMRFARSVDLDLAGRVTDYSTSGTVETWKIGAAWGVNDIVRFRGTLSRDIKAPSATDFFAAGLTNLVSVSDPVLNQTYLMRTIASGTTDLEPEKADTKTIGVVLSDVVPGLSMSVDYYDITINGAISSLAATDIVRRCYSDTPSLCPLITRGADGFVTNIQIVPRNLQTVHESGLDLEADYSFPLAVGTFTLHAVVTHVQTLEYKDGAVTTKLDGSVYQPFIVGANGVPNWRALVSADYDIGPANLFIAARHVGTANINNNFTTKDLNILRVPSVTYVDASFSYRLRDEASHKLQTFVRIGNLLDKDPPLTNDLFGTSATLYDVIGRTYTAGVRLEF